MPVPDLTNRLARKLFTDALDEVFPDDDDPIAEGAMDHFGHVFVERMLRFATSYMTEEELAGFDHQELLADARDGAIESVRDVVDGLLPLVEVITRPPD